MEKKELALNFNFLGDGYCIYFMLKLQFYSLLQFDLCVGTKIIKGTPNLETIVVSMDINCTTM
jgi:hypothetical protein